MVENGATGMFIQGADAHTPFASSYTINRLAPNTDYSYMVGCYEQTSPFSKSYYGYAPQITCTTAACPAATACNRNACGGTGTIQCNGTCSAAAPICTSPTISFLQIGNNSNRAADFTSTLHSSGLQSDQGGKGWYNPMTITLNATAGTGTIQNYYVAFYNSLSLLSASIVDTSAIPIPVAALTDLAANDYFVLKYNSAGRYSVWDPTTSSWFDMTGYLPGKKICNSATCTAANLYYTAYSGDATSTPRNLNLARTWTIRLDKNFHSKTLHTAVSVTDTNGLSAFSANIDPTY